MLNGVTLEIMQDATGGGEMTPEGWGRKPDASDLHDRELVRLLSDLKGSTGLVQRDAVQDLFARYDNLLSEPGEEVRKTLARQAVLLEAMQGSFLRQASSTRNPHAQEAYAALSFKANRALMGVLSAITAMSRSTEHELLQDRQ
jgi:hypothetical protein